MNVHKCDNCGHTRTIVNRSYPYHTSVRPQDVDEFLLLHIGTLESKKKAG